MLRNINTYDRADMVRMVSMTVAGPMKLAAYRVREPDTNKFGSLQFHFTYDNTVMAVMGEEAAKLFARFITDNITPKQPAGDAKCAQPIDA